MSFHLCSRNCHTVVWLPSLLAIFVNASVVLISMANSRYLNLYKTGKMNELKHISAIGSAFSLINSRSVSYMFWIHCSLVQDNALSRVLFSWAM